MWLGYTQVETSDILLYIYFLLVNPNLVYQTSSDCVGG